MLKVISNRNPRQATLFKSAIQQRYIFVKFFHCIPARNINSYPAIIHYFISLDYTKQNYQLFSKQLVFMQKVKCLTLMENPCNGHKELFLRFHVPTKSIKLTISLCSTKFFPFIPFSIPHWFPTNLLSSLNSPTFRPREPHRKASP